MLRYITFLMFLPVLSHAQSIIWSDDDSFLEIGDKLEILEDETGALTYDLVSSSEYSNQFNDSESVNLSLGYTESFFWLRFTIDNRSGHSAVLEVSQAGIPQADLYYGPAGSGRTNLKAGYQIPLEDKLFKSSFQVFPIPKGENTYYLRLNSNSEPIPVRLQSVAYHEDSAIKYTFSYGIYLGLMLFVVLNSLFFSVSLRNKMYLFYAFIVLIYISYSAAVIDGFIVYFIPNVDLIFLYTTIPALGMTVQTLYCILFLEAKKYVPQVYKAVLGIVIYFALWSLIKFFFSFPVVQPINTVNALVSFFVMGYVGVAVGKKGHRMGYYFALAYFIYFALVAVQAIYINTGSPEYIGGLSHVAYATLAEALILSFLLSKRTEWERVEVEKAKIEAQQKVIETIKENERIIQDQNAYLEIEVEKRTEQLHEVNLELQAANDSLKESNDEKVQANQMLTDQKGRLEKQHKEMENLISTKDRFFSIISHDLRGPVSSFMGLTSLIKRYVEEKEYNQLNQMADLLDKASNQLSNLLDNLLNWAVNQQGDFPYMPEKVHVSTLINEVINMLQNMADSKEIVLTNDIDSKINIDVDLNSVMTIFRNLVNNSLKFTKPGGQVMISAEVIGDVVCISVKDNGIGMSEEKVKKLFNIRESRSTWGTDGEKGLGLGVQLAYEFSDLNKGSIQVESELDVGTTFKVMLPVY